MKRSWLVQRLKRPHGAGRLADLSNAFSFGGGLRNGGLSKEAMGVVGSIWSFDYMGAAEYEWGEVPKALNALAQGVRLVGFSVETGHGLVHIICPNAWSVEVSERVVAWAQPGWNPDPQVRDATRLHASLNPEHEWDGDVCGWLELDNGFMFFTDHAMFEAACRLFDAERVGVQLGDNASGKPGPAGVGYPQGSPT